MMETQLVSDQLPFIPSAAASVRQNTQENTEIWVSRAVV